MRISSTRHRLSLVSPRPRVPIFIFHALRGNSVSMRGARGGPRARGCHFFYQLSVDVEEKVPSEIEDQVRWRGPFCPDLPCFPAAGVSVLRLPIRECPLRSAAVFHQLSMVLEWNRPSLTALSYKPIAISPIFFRTEGKSISDKRNSNVIGIKFLL